RRGHRRKKSRPETGPRSSPQRPAPPLLRSRGRSSARSEPIDDNATRPVSPEKGQLEKAARVAQATAVMGESGLLQIEATGETVGEAKWSALRELEKLQPGLDKSAVKFQVVSEGERGLLGVGFAPARVIATVAANDDGDAAAEAVDESELAATVRELLVRIVREIGVHARLAIEE